MTKNQDFQNELKEKVKEEIKPSHLKRSKSLNDLPNQSKQREIFVDAPEENTEELRQKINELEDQILELRIGKLKDFGEYLEKKKELKKDLASNVDYGVKEIERLENKLRTINKKKLELQDQLSQTQSKNARLGLRLINEQNKEVQHSSPNPNFWTNHGPTILLLTLTALSIWLLKNPNKHNHQ